MWWSKKISSKEVIKKQLIDVQEEQQAQNAALIEIYKLNRRIHNLQLIFTITAGAFFCLLCYVVYCVLSPKKHYS
jgi:hypothetical protein